MEINTIYEGDNLEVLSKFSDNSVDLIYADPPFFSNRQYEIIWKDGAEIRAFEDRWKGGIENYIAWMEPRLRETWRVLKPTGSMYLHCDWHADAYLRILMDKIFGEKNFINEIIWHYGLGASNRNRGFLSKHDNIYLYAKSSKFVFNKIRGDVTPQMEAKYNHEDKKGKYMMSYGKKYYLKGGKPYDDVWDIPTISATSKERLGYPTQKPEALLEGIIKASSNEGDVVADFFCGGGTTPAVAQRLGRRWIASDISRIAIEVTKGRILRLLKSEKGTQVSFNKVPNIEVWSWGFYDAEKLQDATDEEFKDFIVRAYGGRPVTSRYANGSKNGIPILVGDKNPKKPITKKEVLEFAQYIQENYELNKTGTILAWGFTESAIKAQEALANTGSEIDFVKIKTVRIGTYEFIEDVITKNKDYKKIFRFVFPPEVVLHISKEDGEFIFDFSDSTSLNNGKIINIQADFDFDGKFAPSEGYIFNPNTMILKYKFKTIGKKRIAFKIEDDQGGEKLIVKEVE